MIIIFSKVYSRRIGYSFTKINTDRNEVIILELMHFLEIIHR